MFRKLASRRTKSSRIASRKDTANEMESGERKEEGKKEGPRRSDREKQQLQQPITYRAGSAASSVVGTANLAGSFQERERRRERERLLSLVSGASCAPVALRLSSDTWHACRVPTTACPGVLSARGNFCAPPPPPRTRPGLQFIDMSSEYFFLHFLFHVCLSTELR